VDTPSTTAAEIAALRTEADLGLGGRVAIVTGGGQGLGRVFAKAYAAHGAIPVIADINEARGAAVEAEIRSANHRALFVPTDVADYAAVARMADRVRGELGRIDALVNGAAIFSTLKKRPFDEIPLEEWDRVVRVNVSGVFHCCRAVMPAMKGAKYGRIINISSNTALTGRPDYLHYTTTKSALLGMTRSLAREVGKFGITVNTLMPGATETEIPRETVSPQLKAAIVANQCIPRPETPEDLARVVMFLSSDLSRFVTGQTIIADGGLAHV